MHVIFRKFLNALAHLRHPKVPRELRYYISDNYLSRLVQVRWLWRDYINRRPYKTITYQGEFQQELTFVLPFAYWHYKNKTLKKTVSLRDTGCLYFFSPHHVEKDLDRSASFNRTDFSVPNMSHTLKVSTAKWAQVPLKAYYRNDRFVFSKPILVISNKYNHEWGGPPVNFISLPTLQLLVEKFSPHYQVIYNRPSPRLIVGDNSSILDLDDETFLRRHPGVLSLNKLYEQVRGELPSFNQLQLMVYANCERFISVHGGNAALASYFGGTNIILSKRGVEHSFREFQHIFPMLSKCNVIHVKSENALLLAAEQHF